MSPEEFLAQKTRVLEITKETRTANAIGDFGGALEDMPHYCVTIGIYEIAHARKNPPWMLQKLAQGSCAQSSLWRSDSRFPGIFTDRTC